MAPDKSHFIVMVDFGRLGFEAVVDPHTTLAEVIDKIAGGDYEGHRPNDRNRVDYVVEFNVVEGWSRDITQDIRDAVADRLGEDRCEELIAPLTSPVTAWAIRDAARVAS